MSRRLPLLLYGRLRNARLVHIPIRLRCVLKWLSLLVLSALLLAIILNATFPLPLPDSERSFARVVTDRNGVPLRFFADKNGVWRYPISVENVSPLYLEALLGYEDRWFYTHPGVNLLALVRALAQAVYHREFVSGGSTITMQVARILEPHEKTFLGKSRQMARALQLEWQFSKTEILELYLNYAPFGGPLEGVQAASFAYFDKPAIELTHAEAALLAVLPQAPSRLRPDRHASSATVARDKVLDRLDKFKVWTSEQIVEAKREPVYPRYAKHAIIAPLLARRLVSENQSSAVIRSTIDVDLQRDVEALIKQYIRGTPKGTSAAVIVLDNKTMEVRSYIGSADFSDKKRFAHVDMVSAVRSPGSTLKPFLYGLALDAGLIHEQSLLLDVPSDFSGYEPENFSRNYSGAVSASEALRRSLNIPAVQILNSYGAKKFYAHLQSFGLGLKIQGDTPSLALILGGVGTSLERLSQSFSSFGRAGLSQSLTFLVDDKTPRTERRLMSEAASWIISNVLRGQPGGRYENYAGLAKRKNQMTYKTGTSYGNRDAWVLATSKQLTIGVWTGRPDGSAMNDNNGRASAVPLLGKIIALLPQKRLSAATRPESVKRSTICWPLSTLQSLQETPWCMQQRDAWLIDGLAPANQLHGSGMASLFGNRLSIKVNKNGERITAKCNEQVYEQQDLVLWPVTVEPWLPEQWHRKSLIPPLAKNCQLTELAEHSLKIVGVKNGDVISAALNIGSLPELVIGASGGTGRYYWYYNGQSLGKRNQISIRQDMPGEHSVSVIDNQGGVASIKFQVLHEDE